MERPGLLESGMDLATVVFDPALGLGARLEALLEALDARGIDPTERERALMEDLLRRPAYALPLEILFGVGNGLPPVLVDPHRPLPDAVDIDPADERAFITRFAGLDAETVAHLEASHLKYLTLLGLMGWDACYASAEEFEADRMRYELIVRKAASGSPIADWETFAYIAGRDWGASEDDVDAFSRMQLVYYFALGVAELGEADEPDDGAP